MATETPPEAWWKTAFRRNWPWLVLASLLIPAIWHVVDFDEDVDPEFPGVERPTFSRVPASAYRLAEPGDTLDRIELYMAAAGVVLAAGGLAAGRDRGLWPAGLAIALAGLWYSATPGPAVDGWYGLGWRTIYDASAALLVALRTARRGDRAGRGRGGVPRPTAEWHGYLASADDPRPGRPCQGWVWPALDRRAHPGGRTAVRDPGRRARRLLAALGDDRGTLSLRPRPPDRAGPAPEIAIAPMGPGPPGPPRLDRPGGVRDRRDLVSPAAGTTQGGRARRDLPQRDADATGPGGRPGTPALPDDHQPLPRGDRPAQPDPGG